MRYLILLLTFAICATGCVKNQPEQQGQSGGQAVASDPIPDEELTAPEVTSLPAGQIAQSKSIRVEAPGAILNSASKPEFVSGGKFRVENLTGKDVTVRIVRKDTGRTYMVVPLGPKGWYGTSSDQKLFPYSYWFVAVVEGEDKEQPKEKKK